MNEANPVKKCFLPYGLNKKERGSEREKYSQEESEKQERVSKSEDGWDTT